MDENHITDEAEASSEEVFLTLADELPEQSGDYPKWKAFKRKHPKWGEVTRQGLVIGRGATQKVIPPDDVYKLAAMGCGNYEIARWFEINEDTLHYNFSDYIEKARSELKQKLRHAQIQLALQGNATMLIWLGKNILGQSDTPMNAEDNKVLPWTED